MLIISSFQENAVPEKICSDCLKSSAALSSKEQRIGEKVCALLAWQSSSKDENLVFDLEPNPISNQRPSRSDFDLQSIVFLLLVHEKWQRCLSFRTVQCPRKTTNSASICTRKLWPYHHHSQTVVAHFACDRSGHCWLVQETLSCCLCHPSKPCACRLTLSSHAFSFILPQPWTCRLDLHSCISLILSLS